jgi:putative copper export protein
VIAELTDWLLLLHILAAIVWLGGLVMLSLLATLVLRSRDGEAVTRFVGSLRVIGPVALALAMVALLGF